MRVNFMGVVGPKACSPSITPRWSSTALTPRTPHPPRLSRYFSPSHYLFVLPRLAEISLPSRLRTGRRRPVLPISPQPHRPRQPLLYSIARKSIDDHSLLCYAGLLRNNPAAPSALELILLDYFAVPVKVEQFSALGTASTKPSQCNLDDTFFDSQQLGFGAVAGDEIWDPQSRVRIVLGPLSLKQYLDFLPSGSAFRHCATSSVSTPATNLISRFN